MGKYLTEIVVIFIAIYISIAFAAPLALKAGSKDLGMGIHSVYRIFCHQRVERSAFLFGEDSFFEFYSREELKEKKIIPERNLNVPEAFSDRIFGYPYVGNAEVGYKMPLCIRDVPIYIAFVLTSVLYLLLRKYGRDIRIDWKLAVLLMLPMAFDGTFQYAAEFLRWEWVPEAYINNIPKRILTGGLFGVGFAAIIIPMLKENVEMMYNSNDNEELESTE